MKMTMKEKIAYGSDRKMSLKCKVGAKEQRKRVIITIDPRQECCNFSRTHRYI